MQHLQKTGGTVRRDGRRNIEGRSPTRPRSIPFLFTLLRIPSHNGQSTTRVESIASARFPSRRRVYPTHPIREIQPLPRYLLTSLPLAALPAPPATLLHPWHANASANTSSPISTGAKRLRAPFPFPRIPPFRFRHTTNTAVSKLVQATVN